MLTGEFFDLRTLLLSTAECFDSVDKNLPLALIDSVHQIKDNILKDEFKILVVGEFSRGKSTFINAILREKALPSSLRPTTATINYIRYHDTVKMDVTYEDGTIKNIPFENIKDFVTVSGMEASGNNGRVKEVNIGYPSDVIKDGAMIVDTPGVNDPDEHREEITTKLLPSADAVIFLLSLDQPVSRSEKDFLRTKVLNSDTTKIFYVVNKIDTSDDDAEIDDTLIHIRSELRSVNNVTNTVLYPISAKMALNGRLNCDSEQVAYSRIELFENSLANFLVNERGQQMILRNAAHLSSMLQAAEALLGTESKQLTLGLDKARERLVKAKSLIHEKVNEGDNAIKSAEKHFDELVDRTRFNWIDGAESVANELKRSAIQELTDIAERTNSADDFALCVSNHYRSILADKFDNELTLLEQDCRRISNELLKSVVIIEKSLADFIDDNSSDEFGDNQSPVEDQRQANQEILDITAGFLKGGALGFVGSLLLGPIGVGGIFAYFIGNAIYNALPGIRAKKYETNVHSLIDDYSINISDALVKSIENYKTTLSKNIVDNINSQCMALQENQVNIIDEISRMQSNISNRQSNISTAINKLRSMQKTVRDVIHSASKLNQS